MSDYGLGSSAAGSANGTSTPVAGGGERREQRAKDDHGEVEVQWGREKLRVPLPPPSSPLSHFRATLYNMTGVPPSHQKLIYAGAVLKDDLLPMSSYGLVEADPAVTTSSSASDPNASESKGRSFWDSWSLMGRKASSKKGLKKLVMLGSATVSARVDDHLSTRKDLQDLAAASPSGSVASAPGAEGSAAGAGAGMEEKKVDSEETVQSRIRQIAVHKLDELEPQVKQVETWLAQEQARRSSGTAAPGEEAEEAAPPPKRLLLYLSENLLQGLLKLDSIEIPSGYAEARKERKDAVRRVQEVLDRVDGAKEGWKKLGLSFS
ncbi:hypothetical protein JCM10908_000419 [Rhodotorula pacifica]|uniref:BAG family molecular chaperone regulator n=1 Tax=Rhodotorula pacifica TaxID=1495444 RepID=UPI00317BBEF0